jgi:uncharacterized protein
VIYVDTSVLVALFANEPRSAAVARWYASSKTELTSASWCITEFASALGIKQRTNQMNAEQAQAAWERFTRLAANDLRLLAVTFADFDAAAKMTLDAGTSLRAGDALHLACAVHAGAKGIFTLDDVLGRNARRLKIKPVAFD